MGPSYRKAAVITAINRHRRLWANGELPVFSGQPATALQQLKPSMRQKRNGLGVRHGRVQPPCYTHRRPIDGASIARSTALAQRPGIDDGSLVSGWSRFLLSVCLAAFLLLLIRCRRFWVKARESSDNRSPIVPLLRPRHPKSPTANYPQQNRGDGPSHLPIRHPTATTTARRRLPTSTLESRCPGGIST